MTCKFVLKCIIREKWLVNNNELVKAVAETFSIKICFVFVFFVFFFEYLKLYEWCHKYVCDVAIKCKIPEKNYYKLQFIWENESN